MVKHLIFVIAISLLWAGQAGAETSWWISPGGAVVGYDDLIPDRYTNPSGEWQKIRTIPTDCPWRIKVVPEAEAEKLMNEGWEPFGVDSILDFDVRGVGNHRLYTNEHRIYLKRKVCE